MKTILLLLISIASSTIMISFGARGVAASTDSNRPKLVTMAPEQVFSPQGFDSNDSAQLTIAGNLPNSCWKAGPATATVDKTQKTIVIHNQSWVYKGDLCFYILVSYATTIDLGILPSGNYRVLARQRNGELVQTGTLPVSVTTSSSPDDYLYALVEDARFDPQAEGASQKLTLSGTLASSCMELSEIKVIYRAPNVIEVLPIVAIEDESKCDTKKRHFQKEVSLNPSWKGPTLVHVRSLNGQALNKVVEF